MKGDNADIWSHDSGGVVGIALLSGIWGLLKNKMSVAFAPQDILSSDSANDSYDSMKKYTGSRVLS